MGTCCLVDHVSLAAVGIILVEVTGAVSIGGHSSFQLSLDKVGNGCTRLCDQFYWQLRLLDFGSEDPRTRFTAIGNLQDEGILPGVGVRCLVPWGVSVFHQPQNGSCDLVFWVT